MHLDCKSIGEIGNVTGSIHFYADGTLSVVDAIVYEIEKDEIAKLSRSDKNGTSQNARKDDMYAER